MGNGYNQQHLHRRNPTILPIFIFCSRPSIKYVSHCKSCPLSPNTGCMGQRNRSNRIVGCPVAHKFNTTKNNKNNSSGNGIKYFKIKKLFSGKNLTSRGKNVDEKENSVSISIENMDLPLPVNGMKRVPKQGGRGDGDTLWERRLRGAALKSLQLQLIQLNRHQ